MLAISQILADLIAEYQVDATENSRESRLVVPGLTNVIAKEIHSILRERGVTSYLVIGNDDMPDENQQWLRPVGLTSKRMGTFVAVTCPGQLAHVQDSVRGSGGAIRGVAYSEEWPWIDDGCEAFRFDGPVVERLVSGWDTDTDRRTWLKGFVTECLLESTRNGSDRARILLEDILGRFSPSLYPEIDDIRLALLRHCGVPKPSGQVDVPRKLGDATARLCGSILDQCRSQEDIREQVHDAVDAVVPASEQEETNAALAVLLDGIGQGKSLELGVLAFHGCWGEGQRNWDTLDADLLADLFAVRQPAPAEISVDAVDCDRCVLSPSNEDDVKLAVAFRDEAMMITASFALPEDELDQFDWQVSLSYRTRPLCSEQVDVTPGNVELLVSLEESFPNYGSGLPLRLELLADGDVRDNARFRIHLCGEARPALVLIEPGRTVVDATTVQDDDASDKKVDTTEAVHLYLFSASDEEPKVIDRDAPDEDVVPIIPTGMEGIWRTAHRLDPSERPSGQLVLECCFEELAAVICLEASDIERGEFTIEEEFREAIAGRRKARNRDELEGIFAGTNRQPYRQLGNLNDATRRRRLLAEDMTSDTRWRPLLLDLSSTDYGECQRIGEYLACRGEVEADGFRGLVLPSEAVEYIQDYARVRRELLEEVEDHLDPTGNVLEHPVYATHPVYSVERSSTVSNLIEEYLKSFCCIQEYMRDHRSSLDWNQLFALAYLDCVVHWDGTPMRNSIVLLGPWHPLVVGKRFMVQAALLARSLALREDGGEEFRHLAGLLGDITGFRWLPGLHARDREFEGLYCMPTSDPGWHVAVKEELFLPAQQDANSGTGGFCRHVSRLLGVETSGIDEHPKPLASSMLLAFLKAFPARRCIGVRARKGFPVNAVWQAIDEFLHSEEGTSDTGRLLPGGVHLYTETSIPDELEYRWIDPPISAYHHESDQECFAPDSPATPAYPDIYVLSPTTEVSFSSAAENLALPRGTGMLSVFSEPLCWLTGGQSQLPNSVSLEHDLPMRDQDGPGAVYVTCCATAETVLRERSKVVSSVNLPTQIKCPWAIAPGASIDPAVFVKYVRDGAARSMQERALWDYRFDVGNGSNTYYILSTIPPGFARAVNGFFGREDLAAQFIVELGQIGIAIGGEALKTGRRALGVVGLVGTVRMLTGTGGNARGGFVEGPNQAGFLLPVDSFTCFFGKPGNSGSGKRTDLLAVQLSAPEADDGELIISASGIESKFVSHAFSQDRAAAALEQAAASVDQFRTLTETSLEEGRLPERLALLTMIRFGLRITSPSDQNEIPAWLELERRIMLAILRGHYRYVAARHQGVVVSTEAELPGVAEATPTAQGLWIRLTRQHWPGVTDTSQLDHVRDDLSLLFRPDGNLPDAPPPPSATPPALEYPPPGEETSAEGPLVSSGVQREELPPAGSDDHPDSGTDSSSAGEVEEPPMHPLGHILVGVDVDARRPIYFDPRNQIDPLDNLNIMVTGSSGKGKTQLLKYLVCRLREQGRNVLLLDFKNDFASDPVFADTASLERVFVSFDGLPFNPLIPYPVTHPASGEQLIQSAQHVSGLVSVLRKTYRLGDQQQIAVKNAIAAALEQHGINATGTTPYQPGQQYPDFAEVGDILERDNQRAFNRLDPLFNLGLFREEHVNDAFDSMVGRSIILDLSQIPSEEIRNALAQLVIRSAHGYYNAMPHANEIRQVLVLDEAHRVMSYEYLTAFARECRAYGVGLVLSSQFPREFPGEVSGCMATKILHGNDRDADRVRDICQLIGCPSEREGMVAELDRFQAFMDNRHHPQTLVRTMNYPLYLAYRAIESAGSLSRSEIASISGLDPNKLPVANLVQQLERLGMAEEREGRVHFVRRYD